MGYDADAAADAFIQMLWDHHAEAGDARTTSELLEYVAADLFNAMQREAMNAAAVIGRAEAFAIARPAKARPGYFNPEPAPPTFDEALAMKCDADARTDEARRLKGMV